MSRLRMRMAGKRGAVVVVPGAGPPCPRCGRATDIRSHRRIGARELKKPFYYARWYFCTNRKCQTTTIMPEEFKVFRDVPDMSGRQEDVLRRGDDIVMDVLANEDSKAGYRVSRLQGTDGQWGPWEPF